MRVGDKGYFYGSRPGSAFVAPSHLASNVVQQVSLGLGQATASPRLVDQLNKALAELGIHRRIPTGANSSRTQQPIAAFSAGGAQKMYLLCGRLIQADAQEQGQALVVRRHLRASFTRFAGGLLRPGKPYPPPPSTLQGSCDCPPGLCYSSSCCTTLPAPIRLCTCGLSTRARIRDSCGTGLSTRARIRDSCGTHSWTAPPQEPPTTLHRASPSGAHMLKQNHSKCGNENIKFLASLVSQPTLHRRTPIYYLFSSQHTTTRYHLPCCTPSCMKLSQHTRPLSCSDAASSQVSSPELPTPMLPIATNSKLQSEAPFHAGHWSIR